VNNQGLKDCRLDQLALRLIPQAGYVKNKARGFKPLECRVQYRTTVEGSGPAKARAYCVRVQRLSEPQVEGGDIGAPVKI